MLIAIVKIQLLEDWSVAVHMSGKNVETRQKHFYEKKENTQSPLALCVLSVRQYSYNPIVT